MPTTRSNGRGSSVTWSNASTGSSQSDWARSPTSGWSRPRATAPLARDLLTTISSLASASLFNLRAQAQVAWNDNQLADLENTAHEMWVYTQDFYYELDDSRWPWWPQVAIYDPNDEHRRRAFMYDEGTGEVVVGGHAFPSRGTARSKGFRLAGTKSWRSARRHVGRSGRVAERRLGVEHRHPP